PSSDLKSKGSTFVTVAITDSFGAMPAMERRRRVASRLKMAITSRCALCKRHVKRSRLSVMNDANGDSRRQDTSLDWSTIVERISIRRQCSGNDAGHSMENVRRSLGGAITSVM